MALLRQGQDGAAEKELPSGRLARHQLNPTLDVPILTQHPASCCILRMILLVDTHVNIGHFVSIPPCTQLYIFIALKIVVGVVATPLHCCCI